MSAINTVDLSKLINFFISKEYFWINNSKSQIIIAGILILTLGNQPTFSQTYVGILSGANYSNFHYAKNREDKNFLVKSVSPGYGFAEGISVLPLLDNPSYFIKLDLKFNRINVSSNTYQMWHGSITSVQNYKIDFNFINFCIFLNFRLVKRIGLHYVFGCETTFNFLTTKTDVITKEKITSNDNQMSFSPLSGFRFFIPMKSFPDIKLMADIYYFYDLTKIYQGFHLNGWCANVGIMYLLPNFKF